MTFFDQAGYYAATLRFAEARSRPWLYLVAALWVVCPFLLRTALLNPGDMIWAQYKVQHLRLPPNGFSALQIAVGFTEAVIALAVGMLLALSATLMFYRRSALDMPGQPVATPSLWALAALVPGVLGSAFWLAWTGYFDLYGCVIGLGSAALTWGCEWVCNRLGRGFVLGPTAQTPLLPGSAYAAQSMQGPVFYYIPE
jgi:hypothetical protein